MQSINSEKASQPLRLIQITDCHLGPRPGEQLLGMDTDESLLDVLSRLKQREQKADYVIATGDITSNAHIDAYERFLGYMQQYYPLPLAWLSGNHDLDTVMRRFPSDRVQREYIELEHWQLILLDSSVPGHEHGDITPEELQRLEDCLQGCAKPALVFVHHQPVPVGCTWIDQYVIRSSEALLEIIDRHDQVKGLVWGHVHQAFEGLRGEVPLWATPSTCIQFKPRMVDFALDDTMPGYRWFDLYPDGRIETGVERIAEKAYGIDFASSGY
ncbi:3',5'-cyclic-AMP phosphodiesterase [Pseudomaricurvus alkylphenolicus]|uniref:3',5'-cyclic-AMP phosphodiesterase n=1 Tax=Pseudomaricurvus alkylphenolicus TaxID=1306991 RepID=UPI0030B8DB11